MATIDSLDPGGNTAAQDDKDRDRWFTGIGIAGPSLIAGAMLLLNKIALALFVGFGPIFILCLIFDQTKNLFAKWLYYGIGTVFSLAVLSVMVTIAMKMMAAVTAAFVVKYLASLAGAGSTDGINSMALQQGGLGLLLSTLIVMAPPMAAAFFQGTLAQFQTYSPFGQVGRGTEGGHARGGNGQPPGTVGYDPPRNDSSRTADGNRGSTGTATLQNNSITTGLPAAPQKDEIKLASSPNVGSNK